MVRHVKSVLMVICLILFFFVALLLLFQMSTWVALSDFGYQVVEEIPSVVRGFVLICAIVMIVIIGLLTVRQLREEVHITKESEEGSVTIVESAITRYIKQVVMDIDSVQSVRTEIANTRQGLVVDLYTKVLVTDTLPQIEQTIRSRLREALEQTLGVGGVAAINVIVEGFQKTESRAEREAGSQDETTAGRDNSLTRLHRVLRRSGAADVESDPRAQAPEQETGERDD